MATANRMKAVFLPGNKRVEIRAVEVPTPGPGEVLDRRKGVLHLPKRPVALLRQRRGRWRRGGRLRHRTRAGGRGRRPSASASTRSRPGDRVAVYLGIGCGICEFCRQGNYFLCAQWTCIGFTANGGNAEYIVVPERNCLKIPDWMSYVAAAISTDAFGTLFSACKKLGVSGATVLGIWGLGPMGTAGVLAAKALGARVVVFDPLAERREFALGLGADSAIDPTAPGAHNELRAFTDGAGLTAAVDCSGNTGAHNMALDAVRPNGKVAFIGESRETTIRPSDQLIRKQITLMGSWYFNAFEYDEILRVLKSAEIDLERLATHRFSLDEAETAFRLFDERKTEKAVFVL